MNVVALFDGISCGQVALERANLNVNHYYASEINKHSIAVTMDNYPNTIQMGDVLKLETNLLSSVDLLLGGSPCTNLSCAGKRNGCSTIDNIQILSLDQYLSLKAEGVIFSGQSYLFWEYIRILRETNPTYFLLENVLMSKEWKSIFTRELGVNPIQINSSLVSGQNRNRLYWTNIPNVTLPEDKKISLQDILEDVEFPNPGAIRGRNIPLNKATIVGKRLDESMIQKDCDKNIPIVQCLEVRNVNINKSNCLTTVQKDNVLTPLSPGRYPDAYNLHQTYPERLPFRHFTRLEQERLQTLPEGYTKAISESAARAAIGNGWTVDVITHILSFLPNSFRSIHH